MKDKNFKVGENVELDIYDYGDEGVKIIKTVKGKVHQLTNELITIDNGIYKESYKYCELEKRENQKVEGEPYDLSLENYCNDIIENCIMSIKETGKGNVFTQNQLDGVMDLLPSGEYITEKIDNIFIIKKK